MTRKKRNILQGIGVLTILACGVLGFMALGSKQLPPPKKNLRPPLPAVDVHTVTITPSTLHLTGQGTVIPVQVARITTQVPGKIVLISQKLLKGGRFAKGETLFKIESADYELALSSAQASLKQAQSNLLQVKESSRQAFFEWQLAHPGDERLSPPPLAIKLPQLQAAQAALKAARAEVDKARLNLKRTVIKAPFDGIIEEKNIDLGQYVSPAQNLAVLYGTKAVEVQVPLLLQEAQKLRIPGFNLSPGAQGSRAAVRENTLGSQWTGKIIRCAGQVDEQTRMLDVYVRIDNPYQTSPPLSTGLFVEVDFAGPFLDKACRIPASALHENDTVWVIDAHNRLHIRKVAVAKRLTDQVLIARGLESGERIVTTPLAEVRDGIEVKVEK